MLAVGDNSSREETLRGREIDAIIRLTRVSAAGVSPLDYLHLLQDCVTEGVEADAVYLVLLDSESGQLSILNLGGPHSSGRFEDLEILRGLAKATISERACLRFDSNSAILEYVSAAGVEPVEAECESLIAVPIWHRGQIEGALIGLCFDRKSAFDATDEDFLSILAMEFALGNAAEKLDRGKQSLETAERLIRVLIEDLDTEAEIDPLLTVLAQRLQKQIPFAQGGFLIADPNSGALERHSSFIAGKESTALQSIESELREREVTQSGNAELGREGNWLSAPLFVNSKLFAMIFLEREAPYIFEADEAAYLEFATRQIAPLIERLQNVERSRRRTDQLAAFNSVASTVHEWLEVEQLAQRVLGILLQVTGTRLGFFYLIEPNGTLRLVREFGVALEHRGAFRDSELSRHPALLRILESGSIQVVDDPASVDFSNNFRALARRIPMSSLAVLPLRTKGRALGFIGLAAENESVKIDDVEFVQSLVDQAAQAIENARLFGESRRRLEEQSLLRELAQRFLSALDPEEVLERTLEALSSLLDADYFEILLPDGEGGNFRLACGRGWRPGVVGRLQVPNDPRYLTGYALMTQAPLLIEDLNKEQRFEPLEHHIRHQVASGVCAPMLAETRAIGILGAYSREARHFTPEQSHFIYLVATQTAIALEKSRHSQAAQRRLDELTLLNDVVGAATSEASFNKLLDNIAGEVSQLLESDQVHIYFVDTTHNDLVVAAARRKDGAAALPPRIGFGVGVAGWVAQSGLPILIPDSSLDERFSGTTGTTKAEVCVPMKIRERVIGVIAAESPTPNVFDESDLRLLSTLAHQVAATVERARLLNETEQRLTEISDLFELTNLMRTATTEERLQELIVSGTVRLLNARGGSLQILSEDEEVLRLVATHGLGGVGAEIPRTMGGVSWDAVNSGESYVIENVHEDVRIRLPELIQEICGAIIAPLRTPTHNLGTLFVGFDNTEPPTEAQLHLVTTIANLAAHAMQRQRLYEQTVGQAEFLRLALRELQSSYQATLLALSAALDARDRETEGHSKRVMKLALAIGQKLKLSPGELTALERGALLHDIGKIGISDNILLKPGPLTPEERELMNRHPEMGHEMLQGIPFLQDVLPIVLYHQEMFDGSGYPYGMKGEEIPLGARIFAVADTYDAMTSSRPYREAMPHEIALEEIERCAGSQFDPVVVAAFKQIFEDGPLSG